MSELTAVRRGIYWLLVLSFAFGVSERATVTLLNPNAITLALLSISALCLVLFLFLKPE